VRPERPRRRFPRAKLRGDAAAVARDAARQVQVFEELLVGRL
jgi:hypothetical protein